MARGYVTFDIDACKGCELCVAVCPQHIIELSKDKINSKGYHPAIATEAEKCIGCGNCAVMCPDSVITVTREVNKTA